LAAISLAVGHFVVAPAFGVERTWGNAAGGTFQTAANWVGGVVPLAADDANFDANSSQTGYNVTSSGAITHAGILVNDNVMLSLGTNPYTVTSGTGAAIRVGTDATESSRTLTLNVGTLISNNGFIIGPAGGSPGGIQINNTGTLLVTAGAPLISDAGGSMNIFGFCSLPSLTLAPAAGASATVAVALGGSANVQIAGALNLSGAGSAFSGGSTVSAGTLNVAAVSGAVGTFAHLAGAGSFGTIQVGLVGSGTLLLNGGTLTSTSASIGDSNSSLEGGTGFARVSGGTWTNTNGLVVGETNSSQSLVQSHGTLIITGSVANVVTGTLALGTGRGAGTVSVSNIGSLTVTGTATIGSTGTGRMDMTNGRLSAGTIVIGSTFGGTGELNLFNGSTATVTNILRVGFSGTGSMLITGGSSVNAGSVTVGRSIGTGGSGTLVISGPASVLSSNTSFTVDQGFVRVENGGILATGTSLNLNPGAVLELNGGTLSAGSLIVNSSSLLQFNTGTIIATGASGFTLSSLNLGEDLVLGPGKHLQVNHTMTIPAASQLTLSGGGLNASTLTINASGELLLSQPTSNVVVPLTNNSGRIVGNGTVAGALVNLAGGEVRANSGESIRFTGSGSNSGLVNLFGGNFETGGTFTNTATGRINGRGVFRASQLNNSGTVQLSAGVSDFFGNVQNFNGSKIIVTGNSTSNFYDNVSNFTGSEFRVSTGSTAVFFGVVSGLSQFTGPGTKIFEGPASDGRINTSGHTIVGPGGDVTAAHVRETSLSVEGNLNILPDGSNFGVSRVNFLDVTPGSGRFDLADNDLVVDYTGASPYSTVRSYLVSGRNFGAWNGTGINSSTAAANVNQITGLGLLEGSDYIATTGAFSFSGQPIDASSLLIKYTYNGDSDLNGEIDFDDYVRIDSAFLSGGGDTWFEGDSDYSMSVDFDDYALIDAAFLLQGGPLDSGRLGDQTAQTAGGITPGMSAIDIYHLHASMFGQPYIDAWNALVPEPTATIILPALWIFASHRRRRS
jgi:hypothetical protein